MLTNPIAILAFLAMLPALFVVSRALTRMVMDAFFEDRLQITFRSNDGRVFSRQIKVSRDQEIDRLLTDIAYQAKRDREVEKH
jgi:hypothetical protein